MHIFVIFIFGCTYQLDEFLFTPDPHPSTLEWLMPALLKKHVPLYVIHPIATAKFKNDSSLSSALLCLFLTIVSFSEAKLFSFENYPENL